MADRGDGKRRFDQEVGTGPVLKRSWELVDTRDQLILIFHSGEVDLPPQRLVITEWRVVGKQAPAFAEAFARHYVKLRRSTRANHVKVFRDCFCVFLAERKIKIDSPSDATRMLLREFYRWNENFQGIKNLGAEIDARGRRSQQSPLSTRMDRAKPVKAIFAQLIKHSEKSEWNVELPKNPFAGKKFGNSARKEIDLDRYLEFLQVSASEALKTISEVRPHLGGIAKAVGSLRGGNRYDSSRAHHVVARTLIEYDGFIPERKMLKVDNPELFDDVEAHGYSFIRRLAQPQAPDLVPFLYVVAAHTGFNQQPLTYLELSQIEEPTLFGASRMTLSPPKYRARSVVRRSFGMTDEELSVPSIIRFIRDWTTNIRKAAPEFARNDLWLFANKWKSGKESNMPIRSLAAREKNAQGELSSHFVRYCKSHNFDFIGLRQIRLSFADLFLQMRPGDLQGLRVLLGQKYLSTPAKHYQTQRALADGQELLAGTMSLQQRWVTSRGKIDTRSTGEKRERTAATPGFVCLDPFDSPILGQQTGKMCDAYGRCPECPLAAIDGDRPFALARLLQLEEAFVEAKGRLGIEIWKRKYQRSSDELNSRWLPSLKSDADLLKSAGKLLLPSLPELE